MASSYNLNNLYLKPTVINGTAVNGQMLTVDGTAGGVAFSTFNDKTTTVMFDVQTADVTCTIDGQTPAPGTKGFNLVAGEKYTWSKAMAQAAKFIRTTSTSGAIWAQECQM